MQVFTVIQFLKDFYRIIDQVIETGKPIKIRRNNNYVILRPESKKFNKIEDHPFFGMDKNVTKSVSEVMAELRESRFRNL